MKRKGQSIIEYVTLIFVVSTALVAMTIYVRRATQGNLKLLQEQVNYDAINE